MTKDSIFLILSTNFSPRDVCENCRSLRIYEDVEKNGIRKWSNVWEFGRTENDIFFPPIIQPIDNGKFILFPQETKPLFKKRVINMKSFNPIELWEINKTLTRSSLELPIDLRDNIEKSIYHHRVWILQM